MEPRTERSKLNIDEITNQFGIRKLWLANQLGITKQLLYHRELFGFPPDEVKAIQIVLNNLGTKLQNLKLPEALQN